MKASEFVEPYSYSIPEQELRTAPLGDELFDIRLWSVHFGKIVHDYLSGKPHDATIGDRLTNQYMPEMRASFSHLYEIVPKVNDTNREAASQLHFHSLNINMMELWDPIVYGGWTPNATDRNFYLNLSQDRLALAGLTFWRYRLEVIRQLNHDYEYYSPQNWSAASRLEGQANDIDGAVVLLEAVRHDKDLTVVPAPYQFSHSAHKSQNSNFLVISNKGDAAGVQVRTKIVKNDYDPARIVPIDAQIDMGNVLYRRVGRNISKTIGWAGIISTQRVLEIPTQGSREEALRYVLNLNPKATRKEIRRLQEEARSYTSRINPQLKKAASIIGPRLTKNLYENPDKKNKDSGNMVGEEGLAWLCQPGSHGRRAKGRGLPPAVPFKS